MKIYRVTRYRIPAILSSFILIAAFWGYTVFVNGGFNFGIDFKAGLSLTADVPSASNEQSVRAVLAELNPQVQTAGDKGTRFIIRIADDAQDSNFQQDTSSKVSKLLLSRFSDAKIISEEYIGSSFAITLANQTILVTAIALALILLYIWIRFHLNYAVSAIVALFHDVLFILGVIGAFRLEFSTATIAAVLTIIGYSLNDTIVIFDRIRENSNIVKDHTFREIIDISITQSLSRTLITSITTLLAVLTIMIFTTGTIQNFALSLVIGVCVGTYSSVFIASPVLLAWHDRVVRRVHKAVESASPSRAAAASSSAPASVAAPVQKQTSAPAPVQQSAEEIALATEKRAKQKAKKKKRRK